MSKGKTMTMRSSRLLLIALAASVVFCPVSVARNQEFVLGTQADFLQGELTDLAVSSEGGLRPAPVSEQVFSGEAHFIWSLVPDGDGGVYAATGSEGVLYRIRPNGDWERLQETFEYELFALTKDASGDLYLSGAPNGTVQRYSEGSGLETILDLPEGLVWDLLAAPDGEIYAAVGESGEIYRIVPDGESVRVGGLPDIHATTLSWWQGKLLCGTDGRGLLVSVDPSNGETEVLYDTSVEEVAAILPLDDGRVLFAANGQDPGFGNGQMTETKEGMIMGAIEVHPNGNGGPTLYERLPNGLVRAVWHCSEENILCLVSAPGGGVLVGTAQNGVLYHLDEAWNATRLADLAEAQLLSIATSGDRVFLGTGSGGSVYMLDWSRPRAGAYESHVLDAGQTATWGIPDWLALGEGSATCLTRSGHIQEQGETWSEWTALAGGKIASPGARYLQLRYEMSSAADDHFELRSIRIPYRGPNRAPRLWDVRVSDKAAELQGNGSPMGGPVRQTLPGGVQVDYTLNDAMRSSAASLDRAGHWARSLRTAIWSAADPDDDPLRFDLYLRGLEEGGYLPLKLDLAQRAYSWDASAWPEGWYELKVIGRDEEGNPPEQGLVREAVSPPFQIDNSVPVLQNVQLSQSGGIWELSGTAKDANSRIAGLEFSLNGEGWRMMLPQDGLFDGSEESFRVPLPETDEGDPISVVGVRASDEAGHLAVARLPLPAAIRTD